MCWSIQIAPLLIYCSDIRLIAYSETYQLTKEERYRELCDQTVSFIEREMTHPKGGFYSAIDADSEGIEGKYYVWDQQEIYDSLGDNLGDTYCKIYNISEAGNFEEKNIPNLIGTSKHTLVQMSLDLEKARQLLFSKRKERVYPHIDDKILTSWNSLMIVALAKVSRITGKEKCLDLAMDALRFIESNLIINERVMVRYRDEEVKLKGYIDDYAFLAWAYLELYESIFDLTYLKKAKHVIENMISLFWDDENGGFYFYGHDAENLIVREKEIYDSALPSGNSVAAFAMAKLADIIGDPNLLNKVEKMFNTFKNSVELYPSGHTFFLQSLIQHYLTKKEVVIIGSQDDRVRKELLEAISERFLPNLSVLVAEHADEFRNIADYATDYKVLNTKTTVYICKDYSCKQPLTDIDEIFEELNLKQTENYVEQH